MYHSIQSNQTIIQAKIFVAKKITEENLIPSIEYIQTILTDARQENLPEEYT
jgi:hypothetical protein